MNTLRRLFTTNYQFYVYCQLVIYEALPASRHFIIRRHHTTIDAGFYFISLATILPIIIYAAMSARAAYYAFYRLPAFYHR